MADLDTGAILGACGPHEQHAPASVQKLLLVATTLARLDPKQIVEVIPADLNIERGSSAVGLVVGGHYSIETLWLGLLLVSGNDAANVLARVAGGDTGLQGTMRAENDLAHQLGARDTNAVTPNGLDAPGQFTSVYDLALIAKVCFGLDDFRKYALTQSAQIPAQPPKDPRGFQIQNENKLILQYKGVLGGKTGYTTTARHSYVGAAERNGRRLVVTMLDAEAAPLRGWQQGGELLDWGFTVPDTAAVGHLVKPGELDATPSPTAKQVAAGQKQPANSAAGNSHSALKIGISLAVLAVMIATGSAAVLARRQTVRRNRRRRASAAWAQPMRDTPRLRTGEPPVAGRYDPRDGRVRDPDARDVHRSGQRRADRSGGHSDRSGNHTGRRRLSR